MQKIHVVIKAFFVTYLISQGIQVYSQSESSTTFLFTGKIEYEKRTNQHAFIDENAAWGETVKKDLPKFVSRHYDLTFNDFQTSFKPGRETSLPQTRFWGLFDVDNVVINDLTKNVSVTQKTFSGDTYLVSDSLSKMEWKIGTEIRTIAGFECRKAVTKILDSIVVIAFYAVDILPRGGPESFKGLPGMILGVAIPRLHTTWYATKVILQEPSPQAFDIPSKGKLVSQKDFELGLVEFLKDQGAYGARMRWQLLL